MKLYCSVLLLFAIRGCASINYDLFIFNWGSVCFKDETYWKVIDKFFDPLEFIDVRFITEPNSTAPNNPLISLFLQKLMTSKSNKLYIFA